jgi:hypothetical protein
MLSNNKVRLRAFVEREPWKGVGPVGEPNFGVRWKAAEGAGPSSLPCHGPASLARGHAAAD